MKKLISILLSLLVLVSCNNDDPLKTAPEIPPVGTMVIDFGDLGKVNKSAVSTTTNWLFSAVNVGVWSGIIGTTFAIPVAAFKTAFNHEPTPVGDLTWQWEYSVDGFTSKYKARLVAELESASKIKWEMYISKTGIDPFEEFLWFEGKSNTDGKSGLWILYHSAAFPEKAVQIDWKRDSDEVGEVKYTYVREKNDARQTDNFKGSTLAYGIQKSELDAFVTIHAYDFQVKNFTDTQIEWSRQTYAGRVKAAHFYNDTNWHCWNSQGLDVVCN